MWDMKGESPAERMANAECLRREFESLVGRIPGMIRLEIGIDHSHATYACDVVLYSEFNTQAALDAYATHTDHLRIKKTLGDIRIARHQVDYEMMP
jgi:hypothetical protein